MSVNIVNPLPVPVTGTTTVSGTVAATQSGLWSVGITGTPNVNVANPATAPALFLNVNDPGRIPYQSFAVGPNTCSNLCEIIFPAVPDGHRLVIQHVSVNSQISTASAVVQVVVAGGNGANSFFLVTPQGNSTLGFVDADQPVLEYVDSRQMPLVAIKLNLATFNGQPGATITGYMLDCTIAPCAAIAQ